MIQFASNQLFIPSNIEDLSSSTSLIPLGLIIHHLIINSPHFGKSFFIVIKVYLNDPSFILIDDALDLCDLFGWVKFVTVIAIMYISSFNKLAITYCEFKYINVIPLYFSDGQVSEFSNTFVDQCLHFRNSHKAFGVFNCFFWNDSLTVEDRAKHKVLCSSRL